MLTGENCLIRCHNSNVFNMSVAACFNILIIFSFFSPPDIVINNAG